METNCFFTFTFEKSFYDEGDEKLSLIKTIKWNFRVLKYKLSIYSLKFKNGNFNKILSNKYNKLILALKKIELKLTVLLIYSYLFLRGEKKLQISKSNKSESMYIILDIFNYTYKIRVSMHIPTIKDNSNYFIFINLDKSITFYTKKELRKKQIDDQIIANNLMYNDSSYMHLQRLFKKNRSL